MRGAVRRRGRMPPVAGSPWRLTAGAGLALTAVLFLLPLLTVRGEGGGAAGETENAPLTATAPEGQTTRAARDRGHIVKLLQPDGTVEELTMVDYLFGVVAAEMPAAFEEEALKAQACAARTFTVVRQASAHAAHPQADVCTDSGCCQAYVERQAAETRWGISAGTYSAKISQAVADTDGLGILYQGAPIQAVFFSSAPGQTADAVAVWGSQVDYLKSVSSPEGDEVPNYRSQVVLTAEEVRSRVLAAYPGADLSGDPSGWFGTPASSGGAVTSIPVGGVTLTGSQVRTLFSLRSAAFTVAWDGTSFIFSVTGYGHGVGMSQYGANAMAKEGSSFRDILTWYYTGAQVDDLWAES